MSSLVVDPFDVSRDPALPSLARALDPAEVSDQLQRRLTGLTEGTGRIRLLGVRVVRYKPHRRCVIEYRVELEKRRDVQRLTLLGKVRARRFGKSGYRLLKSLWDAGFDSESADGISVPEPIGTIPEFRMWLQRKVPGRLATDLLDTVAGVDVAVRLAEAAHKLHQVRIELDATHSMQDELTILRERLPSAAHGDPHLHHRIEEILRACDQLAAPHWPNPMRTIHRDFYTDQAIVDGRRVYLLDFDLCCRADPALDLGNLLGHITEQSLRTQGTSAGLRHVEAAALERFVELSGEQHRPAVDVYTTLTLVRHIYLSTLFPERQDTTDLLADLCEERLWRQLGAASH
jgi:hypothetical protein